MMSQHTDNCYGGRTSNDAVHISVAVRLNDHMDHDGFSDKSEREIQDDWDTTTNENGGRLTEESDMDQSDELSPVAQATVYTEQSTDEMAEVRQELQLCVFTKTCLVL